MISLNQQEFFGIKIEVQRFIPGPWTIIKNLLLDQPRLRYLPIRQPISTVRTIKVAPISGLLLASSCPINTSSAFSLHRSFHLLILPFPRPVPHDLLLLFLLLFLYATPETLSIPVIEVDCLANVFLLLEDACAV